MPDKDQLELAGRMWDSSSTGKKLVIAGLGLSLLLASFLAGVWFVKATADNKLASLEAKYERQITELKNKPLEAHIAYSIRLGNSDNSNVPALENAPLDDSTLRQFVARRDAFRTEQQGKTRIRQSEFFPNAVGRRFEWVGYVRDVFGGSEVLTLEISPEKNQKYGGTVTCYFHGDDSRPVLEKLALDQKVQVDGVMNASHNLVNCKLLQVWDENE